MADLARAGRASLGFGASPDASYFESAAREPVLPAGLVRACARENAISKAEREFAAWFARVGVVLGGQRRMDFGKYQGTGKSYAEVRDADAGYVRSCAGVLDPHNTGGDPCLEQFVMWVRDPAVYETLMRSVAGEGGGLEGVDAGAVVRFLEDWDSLLKNSGKGEEQEAMPSEKAGEGDGEELKQAREDAVLGKDAITVATGVDVVKGGEESESDARKSVPEENSAVDLVSNGRQAVASGAAVATVVAASIQKATVVPESDEDSLALDTDSLIGKAPGSSEEPCANYHNETTEDASKGKEISRPLVEAAEDSTETASQSLESSFKNDESNTTERNFKKDESKTTERNDVAQGADETPSPVGEDTSATEIAAANKESSKFHDARERKIVAEQQRPESESSTSLAEKPESSPSLDERSSEGTAKGFAEPTAGDSAVDELPDVEEAGDRHMGEDPSPEEPSGSMGKSPIPQNAPALHSEQIWSPAEVSAAAKIAKNNNDGTFAPYCAVGAAGAAPQLLGDELTRNPAGEPSESVSKREIVAAGSASTAPDVAFAFEGEKLSLEEPSENVAKKALEPSAVGSTITQNMEEITTADYETAVEIQSTASPGNSVSVAAMKMENLECKPSNIAAQERTQRPAKEETESKIESVIANESPDASRPQGDAVSAAEIAASSKESTVAAESGEGTTKELEHRSAVKKESEPKDDDSIAKKASYSVETQSAATGGEEISFASASETAPQEVAAQMAVDLSLEELSNLPEDIPFAAVVTERRIESNVTTESGVNTAIGEVENQKDQSSGPAPERQTGILVEEIQAVDGDSIAKEAFHSVDGHSAATLGKGSSLEDVQDKATGVETAPIAVDQKSEDVSSFSAEAAVADEFGVESAVSTESVYSMAAGASDGVEEAPSTTAVEESSFKEPPHSAASVLSGASKGVEEAPIPLDDGSVAAEVRTGGIECIDTPVSGVSSIVEKSEPLGAGSSTEPLVEEPAESIASVDIEPIVGDSGTAEDTRVAEQVANAIAGEDLSSVAPQRNVTREQIAVGAVAQDSGEPSSVSSNAALPAEIGAGSLESNVLPESCASEHFEGLKTLSDGSSSLPIEEPVEYQAEVKMNPGVYISAPKTAPDVTGDYSGAVASGEASLEEQSETVGKDFRQQSDAAQHSVGASTPVEATAAAHTVSGSICVLEEDSELTKIKPVEQTSVTQHAGDEASAATGGPAPVAATSASCIGSAMAPEGDMPARTEDPSRSNEGSPTSLVEGADEIAPSKIEATEHSTGDLPDAAGKAVGSEEPVAPVTVSQLLDEVPSNGDKSFLESVSESELKIDNIERFESALIKAPGQPQDKIWTSPAKMHTEGDEREHTEPESDVLSPTAPDAAVVAALAFAENALEETSESVAKEPVEQGTAGEDLLEDISAPTGETRAATVFDDNGAGNLITSKSGVSSAAGRPEPLHTEMLSSLAADPAVETAVEYLSSAKNERATPQGGASMENSAPNAAKEAAVSCTVEPVPLGKPQEEVETGCTKQSISHHCVEEMSSGEAAFAPAISKGGIPSNTPAEDDVKDAPIQQPEILESELARYSAEGDFESFMIERRELSVKVCAADTLSGISIESETAASFAIAEPAVENDSETSAKGSIGPRDIPPISEEVPGQTGESLVAIVNTGDSKPAKPETEAIAHTGTAERPGERSNPFKLAETTRGEQIEPADKAATAEGSSGIVDEDGSPPRRRKSQESLARRVSNMKARFHLRSERHGDEAEASAADSDALAKKTEGDKSSAQAKLCNIC
jgi:hypothetical protein